MTELDPAPTRDPSDDAAADTPDMPETTDGPAETPAAATLPPDPVAYDAVRNVHARARGLPAAYIAGGSDPDMETALREERHYGKLLLGMVVGLILGGFVVGILVALATAGA